MNKSIIAVTAIAIVALLVVSGTLYVLTRPEGMNEAQKVTIRANDIPGEWSEDFFNSNPDPEHPNNAEISHIEMQGASPDGWNTGSIYVYLWLFIFENEHDASSHYENLSIWTEVNSSNSQPLPYALNGILWNRTVIGESTFDFDAVFQEGRVYCYLNCQVLGVWGSYYPSICQTLAFYTSQIAYLQYLKSYSMI